MLFGGEHRFFAFLNKRVVAQLGQSQCGLGTFPARHSGGAAAGAGACFKPGCQRIADPCR
ncbi:hypothetical protein D3C81_1797490 [compost metagenome]